MKKHPCVRLWRYEKKRGLHRFPLYFDAKLKQVVRSGFMHIPGFWNYSQCVQARKKIDASLSAEQVKVWEDDIVADRRIMGAHNLCFNLDLFNDERISRWIEMLYGSSSLNGFTMASRLEAKSGNKGSGQGWHRDSAVTYQYKAILYLSDVGPENGPFQYIKGSGNPVSYWLDTRRHGWSLDKYRFEDVPVERIMKNNLVELCGKQGDLMLVNTRGLHRGKSIVEGTRYALTNYYWSYPIPKHITPWING